MFSPLVDFHCHLDLFDDYTALFSHCESNRIVTLAVTTTPSAWPRNRELAAEGKFVVPALGIHPQLVGSRPKDMETFERYLPETRFVGEVGLDGSTQYRNSLAAQKDVFGRILDRCAQVGGRILSVHSLRAVRPVLELVRERLPAERGCVVLHWFTGTSADLHAAIDLGCYFSVNVAMLSSTKSIVAGIPKERLLTESDGPFLRIHGRQSRPHDVSATVAMLARIHDLEIQATRELVFNNLLKLAPELARVSA